MVLQYSFSSLNFDLDADDMSFSCHDEDAAIAADLMMLVDDDGEIHPSSFTGLPHEDRRFSIKSVVPTIHRQNESPRSTAITHSASCARQGFEVSLDDDAEENDQDPVEVPHPDELNRQYKRTLRKLARSMKRSEATREKVKVGQRSLEKTYSGDLSDDGLPFFSSDRQSFSPRREEERKKVYSFINKEALSA